MPADTTRLLSLLREAGDEAVTLDELAIAGVEDPARALLALERAGHGVQRVLDGSARGGGVTCVRLGPPAPAEAARSEPSPDPASAAEWEPARRLPIALGALLMVAVVAVLVRRRR